MQRVVITGYGMISPLGLDVASSWNAVKSGKSGVGPITLFDTSNFPIKYAAEVKQFDPRSVLDHKEVRRQDRFEWLGFAAAKEAIETSGIDLETADTTRTGVVIASSIGGLATMDEQIGLLHNEGPRSLSPFAIPKIMSNGASGMISIAYGIQGPAFSVASACASGADGIGIAAHLIRTGLLDAALAGGADSPITALAIGGFDRIGAVSHRADLTPSPFSRDRDGLIVGEGSGVLMLESLDHAQSRKAEILGELIGYGATADAFHITAPTEDGSGSARAIKMALDDAKLNASNIDYINAHGTGTSLNDAAETKAIKLALGNHAYKLPVSSTKSMTGHMMGATGAVEAIFCLKAIQEQVVPPTINYTDKDEVCDLDYVPNSMRDAKLVTVMSHAFGFGGHNSVLIFQAFRH